MAEHLYLDSGLDDAITGCDARVLPYFLSGLLTRQFTGKVKFTSGDIEKSLFFDHGRICFASSNQIDDRLGEVLFRKAKLTLEELTASTCQVHGGLKFGQVLIQSGVLTAAELWESLQDQVAEIALTIMVYPQMDLYLERGVRPITSLILDESSPDLLNRCANYGAMVRDFSRRLSPDTSIHVSEESFAPVDSYLEDLFVLIQNGGSLGNVMESSKMNLQQLMMEFFDLYQRGLIELGNIYDPAEIFLGGAGEKRLATMVEKYTRVIKIFREAYEAEKVVFPTEELLIYISKQVWVKGLGLILDKDGFVAERCLPFVVSQCEESPFLIGEVGDVLNKLVRYLSYVSRDFLSRQTYKELESESFHQWFRSLQP